MDDLIRLNLTGRDKVFIHDALTGFLEQAAAYGRALIEIRMSRAMLDRAAIAPCRNGAFFFESVPVRVRSTDFDETVEVVLGPVPRLH